MSIIYYVDIRLFTLTSKLEGLAAHDTCVVL